MDTSKHVTLDHREVRTILDLQGWASEAFALAGISGEALDFNALTSAIFSQVGERATSYQVLRLHPAECTAEIAKALAVWQRYFGSPMFHDWGCTVEFAA